MTFTLGCLGRKVAASPVPGTAGDTALRGTGAGSALKSLTIEILRLSCADDAGEQLVLFNSAANRIHTKLDPKAF